MLNEAESMIYEWIRDTLNLPVYADVFYGAALLINQKPTGYINFVSHAGRDIMNGLARTHRGEKRQQVQYADHLNRKIKPIWMPVQMKPVIDDDETSAVYSIKKDACIAINTLIEDHNIGSKRNKEADKVFFDTFLEITNDDNLSIHLRKRWKNAKDGFMSMTHISSDPHNENAESEIVEHYQSLLMFLEKAASQYYNQILDLNDILEDTNQPTS